MYSWYPNFIYFNSLHNILKLLNYLSTFYIIFTAFFIYELKNGYVLQHKNYSYKIFITKLIIINIWDVTLILNKKNRY